jgi:hypothetical protein
MAKKHKIHKSNAGWKRDILLLACILRLRVQPSVPFPEIADLFLRTQPDRMLRLVKHAAPKEIQTIIIENGLKDWLVEHLEEDFTVAEIRDFGTWRKAREMEESVVGEMLRVSGLDFMGYVLTTEKEMQLQIRWRKEGDWRAGSVPEEPGTAMMNV